MCSLLIFSNKINAKQKLLSPQSKLNLWTVLYKKFPSSFNLHRVVSPSTLHFQYLELNWRNKLNWNAGFSIPCSCCIFMSTYNLTRYIIVLVVCMNPSLNIYYTGWWPDFGWGLFGNVLYVSKASSFFLNFEAFKSSIFFNLFLSLKALPWKLNISRAFFQI